MEEKEKKNGKKKAIIVLIVLLLVCANGFLVYKLHMANDSNNKIIEKNDKDLGVHDNSDATYRVRLNTSLKVEEDGTIYNFNFANTNKERLMKCIIKIGDKQIYDSGYVKSGDTLKAIRVSPELVPKGETEAMAVVYSCAEDKTEITHSNIKIKLIKETEK